MVFIGYLRADSQSGEIINNESWLCSPLSVIGTGRDDKDQYLILRWLSFGSETPTTAAIPLADIGEREGWRTLKAGGVNVTTKSSLRAILADWLQRSGSRELWRVAHATGWQCGAYIMPDGKSSEHLKILCCSAGEAQPQPDIPSQGARKAGVITWRVWPLVTIQ